jgi:hypothetical protein
MFECGQKVVCVNDKFPMDIRDYFNALPSEGQVYTIRDVCCGVSFNNPTTPDKLSVLLEEITNLPNVHGIEPGFDHTRFAELEEAGELQLAGYDDDVLTGDEWKDAT